MFYILTKRHISCIPPEILGEIFVCCLPVDLESQLQNIQQLLSSVCKLWRAVVLATPAFWASLIITYGTDVLRPPLPVILTHLQRSGTHPLSFVLHPADQVRFSRNDPHLLTALTTLAAARQRWDSVDIKLFRMTQDILDLIQGDAPLLRSIRCNIYGLAWSKLPVPLRMLDHCSRLELFQWNSPSPRSPILLPLTDTPLTSLSLEMTLSVSECVTILRLSPRLSSVVFDIHNTLGPSVPHLTHPTLRTLKITEDRSNTLLDALTLPALLDLDLMTEYIRASEWGIALLAFLERSKPVLHKLALSTQKTLLEPILVRILTLAPHLCSLILRGRLGSAPLTALIRGLYPQSQPDALLCPRLRILDLSAISDCPDGLCITMLRARWGSHAHANGVACLENAYIELLGGLHDRDRVEMDELCAEGMSGTIFWSGGSREWTVGID